MNEPRDRDRDKKNGLNSLRDAIWDSYREAVKEGYSREDAQRDTNSSAAEVEAAWSDAAADGEN